MNTDWLAQLAPAHPPPPSGVWPPAPGWWIVALLLLAIAATLAYRSRRRSSRLRRSALRELKQLATRTNDDAQLAGELEHLLRRYALAAHGRETVASLSGEAWLAFVAAHGGTELAGEAGRSLLRAAYGNKAQADRTAWLKGTAGFLKGRR